MRHRKKINSLGRKSAHRKKTMSNMASSLILHKRITTTVAKAKALRVYVEPLITKSKEDSTHSRRTVFSYLRNKYAVSELFREVSQKVADRPGGYTRILKTGFRKGDAAEMCFIELVDYNTHLLKTDEDTQQKRTRRGRRRGKAAEDQETEQATAKKDKTEEQVTASIDEPEKETAPPSEETLTETADVKADASVGEDISDTEVKDETETETAAETTAEESQEAEKIEEKPRAEADSPEAEPEKKQDTEEDDKDKETEK